MENLALSPSPSPGNSPQPVVVRRPWKGKFIYNEFIRNEEFPDVIQIKEEEEEHEIFTDLAKEGLFQIEDSALMSETQQQGLLDENLHELSTDARW